MTVNVMIYPPRGGIIYAPGISATGDGGVTLTPGQSATFKAIPWWRIWLWKIAR